MSEQLANEEVSAVLVHSPAGTSLSVIAEFIQCLWVSRSSLFRAAQYLYQIREEKLWEADYSSWTEFLHESKLNAGQASRLCSVYEYFVVKGGVAHAQLSGVDPEKLYLSMRLPYSADEQALRAGMWSRQEIKAELARKQDGSEHECVSIEICKTCGKRM